MSLRKEQLTRIDGWEPKNGRGWSRCDHDTAVRFTVEYRGQRSPSDAIDCGNNRHLADMITAALRRAYEAGAKDKLAELRAFIGVDK